MPKVDGKEYPYTEEGKKAAAAAKKRKGKSGDSFASKYMTMVPGDKEKYAKGRERQEEVDRGERVVGKKTGTIDTSKGKAKAKKHAKGVQRAGEYVQKREYADRYYGQVGFSDQMEYEKARTDEEFNKAHYEHMRTRAEEKAAKRKLDREYPKSAAHRKSMEKADDVGWDAYANRERGSDGQAEYDNAFIRSRATDKMKAKKKAAAKKKARPEKMRKMEKIEIPPLKKFKTKAEKAGDAEKKRLAAASPPKKKKTGKKTGKKPLPRTPQPPARS